MRKVINILLCWVLVLSMIVVAAPTVAQSSVGSAVVSAAGSPASSSPTCQYMLDFGSTYPGIAEDFIPPFKACEAVNLTITLTAIAGDPGHNDLYGVLELVSAPDTTSNVDVTVNSVSKSLNLTDPDGSQTHILEFAGPFDLGPGQSVSWNGTFHFMEPGLHELLFLAYRDSEVFAEKPITIKSYHSMEAYPIDLYAKWNLISLPIVPFDTSIESLLAPLAYTYDLLSVWYYDRATDAWRTYAPGAPSDLHTIEDGKAYWFRMRYGGEIDPDLSGPYPRPLWIFGLQVPLPPDGPSAYPVYTGWNMVGFTSTVSMTVGEYLWNFYDEEEKPLFGLAYGWDATLQDWFVRGEHGNLDPGHGYWIPFAVDGGIYPSSGGIPQMPHQFYGSVTHDGEPVAEGTLVEVFVGGVKQAETAVDSEGRYGWEPILRIPTALGGEVTFRVSGVPSNESSALTAGTIEELDLTIDTLPYSLTISSTTGGSVTTPGEGVFHYAAGTVVNLVATPGAAYHFAGWTGDVATIANTTASSTSITMNGNYSVTANFLSLPPVPVWNWYDLDAARDNLSGHYVLMNDLDSATPGYEELAGPTANEGKGWQPIGSAYFGPVTKEWEAVDPFVGTFDGQGYEVADLFIDRPEEDGVGLFGAVDVGGVITSIGLADATVTGNWAVGALVGQNWYGTIDKSYAAGTITGYAVVGGLVGRNWYGTVSDSDSIVTVTGNMTVGGLVGANSRHATVDSSHSSGTVNGQDAVGGLVGHNHQSSLSKSYSSASITGTNAAGGLVGANNEGTVTNSHASGPVIGDTRVGGLVGVSHSHATVASCHATGIVGGDSWVGGLVGVNHMSTIANSHAGGSVTGSWSVGGLTGTNEDDGEVHNCYSTGSIYGGEHVGGLVGRNGNGATVSTSHSGGDVVGGDYVGGLAGYNTGSIVECYSTGSVDGYHQVGGLLGFNDGIVSSSYSTASVSGTQNVGGLVGGNDADGCVVDSFAAGNVSGGIWIGGLMGANGRGTIIACHSGGTVQGDSVVGGLVGVNYGSVSNSYSAGSVIGIDEVGGLAGRNGSGVDWGDDVFSGSITNCYSTSSVVGHEHTGGLVGHNYLGTITGSYSAGSVTGEQYVGGLVGENRNTVSNSFWDTETSGMLISAGGTGKTTADMKDIATFMNTATEGLDEPWDIVGVASGETKPAHTWNIVDGQTYPFLGWQQSSVVRGDANGDGVINVLDLAWTARIIAGLEENGDTYPGADANQDGAVNVLDLAKIARIIAGLD